MHFSAVLFDLDGTLVWTGKEYRYLVTRKALRDLGLDVTDEGINRFWFEHDRNGIIRNAFGADPTDFWKAFWKHDDPELRKTYTRPYEDSSIVREIRDRGIKVGVVTGASPEVVDIEMGLLGGLEFDNVTIAHPHSNLKSKPSPEGVFSCLKAMGVMPPGCLFVGNSDGDTLAARNAGIPSAILARNGEKLKHKPTFLLDSNLYELRGLIGLPKPANTF
jgi:beta-phosphoglucomutase-like phosphatase (HAD superfamily)